MSCFKVLFLRVPGGIEENHKIPVGTVVERPRLMSGTQRVTQRRSVSVVESKFRWSASRPECRRATYEYVRSRVATKVEGLMKSVGIQGLSR